MSYRIDLRPVLATSYPSWAEQRAALVQVIESTDWFASVVQAVGDDYPFDPDSEYPGEGELCTVGHLMELLAASPDPADLGQVLRLFADVWVYDEVEVIWPKTRHLVLVR
jgi:hypothetical protein